MWSIYQEEFVNNTFEALNPAKKQRIINAALEEFAKHSYDKASTNSIVKNANISKGLLFHYFTNKKTLYNYLSNWSFEIIINALDGKIDWAEPDLFKRLKQVWLIKSEILLEYPYLAKFGETLLADKSKVEAIALVENYRPNIMRDLYQKNIDFTKFKPDIPIDSAMNIIQWTLAGIGENFKPQLDDTNTVLLNSIASQVDVYLNLLKHTFYKEEALDD